MRYFQCSKDKKFKEVTDDKFETTNITQDDGNQISKVVIKSEHIAEILCCGRRMRELTEDQYDHEVLQRDYVDNGGSGPKDTKEMQRLNL